MSDGAALAVRSFAAGLRAPDELAVSEWADRYRVLSKSASAEPMRWNTERTPYLREIMDALSSSDPTQEVVFMKSTQIGGSESALNWIGSIVDQAGGPTMIVLPTSSAAKKASKTRVTPMLQDTPKLRGKVREAKSRGSGNTTLLKEFDGGALIFAGANSASDLKSSPVRNLFMDEIEEYPSDVDGQGDPEELARKRTDTFPRKKIFRVSTPTVAGGRIHAAYQASDQRTYLVPCPHCSQPQELRWPQLRWETRKRWELVDSAGEITEAPPDAPGATERDTGELVDVWYQCLHCEARIEERDKGEMLSRGRWVAQNPGPDRAAGFRISALYSPIGWVSWREIVLGWLEAQRDVSGVKSKTFTNTVLGEPHEAESDTVAEHFLKARVEAYKLGAVPRGCLLLCAGVDVQGDRLEAYVWAYGKNEESWLIDRQILYGSPAEAHTWSALEDLLGKSYSHEGGASLRIAAMAIDASDGNTTHFVREFARKWIPSRRVIAVKGQAVAGKPILGRPTDQDVTYRGRVLKHGVKLWPVGADGAKGWLYGHLKIEKPGPGFVHLPAGLPDEFFAQLTAERRLVRYIRGHPKSEWTLPRGRRNEALDCAVYALAAAHYYGYTRLNWDALEKALLVNQEDLFAKDRDPQIQTSALASALAPPRQPWLAPKKKSWVTNWDR